MDSPKKTRGLGRGLSALMADIPTSTEGQDTAQPPSDRTLPVESLRPNPDQPRKQFTEDDLQSLTESIRTKGIVQPLIVRPDPTAPDLYEIVAGERRWRAAQRAQLHDVPVIVRQFTDIEVLEIAIIENVQRANLNPIEEAQGYRQLIDRFGHTQDQVAAALGKSRSYIANLLRLLSLPDRVQTYVQEGQLSAGHARALITLENSAEIAQKVIDGGLSVRETEKLVKSLQDPVDSSTTRQTSQKPATEKDADTRALEQDLAAQLGLTVTIQHRAESGSGKLTVQYRSLADLDRLCALLNAAVPDESI